MGVKLKKKGYSNLKKVVTGLIPTEWDDLLWDAGEAVVEWLSDSTEDNEKASTEVEISNSEETNYTNNYYRTNNYQTLTANNVITPFRTPVFNYAQPGYRNYPPPYIIPPPILPTDIDNQTSTSTPVGSSITIKLSTTIDQVVCGKTKFHPDSSQKKVIKRKINFDDILNRYIQAQKSSIDAIDKLKANEPIPIQHSGFLVSTEKLNGLKGQGNIIYGISAISTLAQSYRLLSSAAFIEPTNEIPISYEELNIGNNFTDLTFSGEATNVKKGIWDKLGYEENEWNDKTIEDIVKDFGKKIYEDKQLKKIDDKVLFNLKDQFKNIEEFGLGLLATIFYRLGLHRLPGQVPESLLLDKDKYKDPKDQPLIFIEDAIEYQEYLLKNLDGIFGQFPIRFTIKKEDDQGRIKEEKAIFPNISEALSEIIGTLIGIAEDSDTSVALGIKNLIETTKCSNLALTAVDTARSNADYLGYKAEEIERIVTLPFNPNGKNLNEFLTETELKITSFDNVDDNTLQEQLKLISIAAQITKSALGQKKEFITGDAIIQKREEEKKKYDEDWKELLKKYDNSTSTNKIKTPTKPFPNVKIIDKSINNTP